MDANGNTRSRGGDSFAYDQANRLLTATVGGTTTTNVYDGDGKRTSQTAGANPATSYVYDIAGSLPVLLSDGGRKYVYGLGLAYAVDGGGNLQVYHADGLGSVRAITDASGAVLQTLQTDAFGVPAQSQGSVVQPFGFTGQQADTSGLQYLRARFYDPASGRFMSRDPLAGSADAPLSLHRYTYVPNSPLGRYDPSGLSDDTSTPGLLSGSANGSRVKDDGSAQQFACDSPNGQNSHQNLNVACTPPQVLAQVPVQVQTPQGTALGVGIVAMSPTAPGIGGDKDEPHFPTERGARREAFRRFNIPTSIANNFKRILQYGRNPNLRGPSGGPSEIVVATDSKGNTVQIDNHTNGHTFTDVDPPSTGTCQ